MSDKVKPQLPKQLSEDDKAKLERCVRPREALFAGRKAEIIRGLRDTSEAGMVPPMEWVVELAELCEVDIRRR